MSSVVQLIREPEFNRANLKAAIDLLIAENRKLDYTYFESKSAREKIEQLEKLVQDLRSELLAKQKQIDVLCSELRTHAGNTKVALRCFRNLPAQGKRAIYFEVAETEIENICELLVSFE